MGIKGKYSDSAPLYIIFLCAAAAAAAVTFIIVYNMLSSSAPAQKPPVDSASESVQTDVPQGYAPEEALLEEMKDEAIRLILQNHEVLNLYYTRGLPHKEEAYGNAPEGGYYSVDSSEYTSIKQLEDLVDSTYTSEQAKQVKEDSLGYGPIYKERYNGDLGIIENFTPMEYNVSWDNPQFSVHPVSDEECSIEITLHERESNDDITVNATMVKTEDGWRLTTIVY